MGEKWHTFPQACFDDDDDDDDDEEDYFCYTFVACNSE